MATVYLAEDLKHDRKVAVKVLRPELAAVLGAERFVVEIKTTAQLQHPHILPLFDSGQAGGFLYYVMPYIKGETLRSRLDREKQLPIDEAIRITREVADALDYAHRQGVIHRDIKPENILLHDGRPMVADFGIVLAVSAAAGGRMTETGLSLGTPHYMSPEQATADRDITARSDIYSVASVLYEMLTGEPPHMGTSAQQIIMKIVTEDAAPVTKLRKSVPPHVVAAVAQALEKLPADRFESAKAFSDALANRSFTGTTMVAAAQASRRAALFSPLFLAVTAVALVASAMAAWGWSRPAAPPLVSRYSVALPDSLALTSGRRLALSPDGRTIVYVGPGTTAQSTRLWVRPLDQLRATPLAGTDDAVNPAFSPDGKHLAFVANQQPRALKVVPVTGGPALTLTDSLVDMGGVSWGYDGYIYFDGHLGKDGLSRIKETGGPPEVASTPIDGESYHVTPTALPGGKGVLLVIGRSTGATTWDIGVLDLKTHTHTVLTRGLAAAYSPTGHLVYVTDNGTMMAAPFDPNRLVLTGDPVIIADGASVRGNQRVDLALSSNGTLAYLAGPSVVGVRELVWVTRDGAATAVDTSWRGDFVGRPTLSPDGRAAAVTIGNGPSRQVWVKQLDKGPASKLADDGGSPAWSPDGRSIYFAVPTTLRLMKVPADGHTLPASVPGLGSGLNVSPDGKWIVGTSKGAILGARTDGDTATQVLVDDASNQLMPAISPDGRWLAYTSDESGVHQIYVRPFPDTKVAKRQVSVTTGYAPRWSRSGRELFWVTYSGELWSSEITPGAVFVAGTPKRLFSADPYGPLSTSPCDIAPDGRFLFTRVVGKYLQRPDELIVVENAGEDIRAKMSRK